MVFKFSIKVLLQPNVYEERTPAIDTNPQRDTALETSSGLGMFTQEERMWGKSDQYLRITNANCSNSN